MVILLLGLRSSGKTTCMEYLKEKYKFQGFELSSILKQGAKEQGITVKELDEKEPNFGSKKICEQILDKSFNIVVSGVRICEQVDFFMEEFGEENVKLYYLGTDSDTRYDRNVARKRKGYIFGDKKAFNTRDKEDIELGLPEIIYKYLEKIIIIPNKRSKQELFEYLDKLLEKESRNLNKRKWLITNGVRNSSGERFVISNNLNKINQVLGITGLSKEEIEKLK